PGFFVIRRYDRGIREGALHQYPCHIAVFNTGRKMFEYLQSLPLRIHDHFAAMTALVFFATIFKMVFPFLAYLINRVFEYTSYKRLSKIEGVSDDLAREIARDTWRPKSKPPKWLLALKRKLFPKK
ncbi:hypothetical protein, partial [Enterobacter hormaechei]|uniref:hypothetical protein n=1 Tax=Enterobacter hormaechei TaxID=158836 RepID=UPI000B28E6DC